ncbi:ATP-dependent DNA helicase II subunit 1 [Erysiphe neolycopersici]|uniref:ATP-dependent DNA helicase II subunit 1 n=1 Tax=Erysiphe neolycopersici TaxID=212602 RepID=A0A420I8J2_9PEZI|nr:ATP-dependent DNA helicase II subunit 1 [Erysiphe neolycopersici]
MTGYGHGKRDEEEDIDEEDIDETKYMTQKDALLFAIEVNKSMLSTPPGKDSTIVASLKCVYQLMQQQIITSPKDMMGVLLFGTEKGKFQEDSNQSDLGTLDFPHCYLLMDLNIPSAEDVKLLKAISMGQEGGNDILKPSIEKVSLSNMLFCVNQIFTSRAQKFGSRRLFIITDNDNPHQHDKRIRSQAAVRAKDLYDLGIILELFPISHSGNSFDRTKFYDDIVYRDPTEEIDNTMIPSKDLNSDDDDSISFLSKLISDISSKKVAKQALFSGLPFEIGPGLQISINGYSILQKQSIAKSFWVYDGGEELKIAQTEGGMMTDDTAVPIDQADITRAYKFGGTQVYFSSKEEKKIRFFEPPILRILGFKSKHLISIWMSISKPIFIYPSEEKVVGSTRVFSALWKKLLASEKVGIGWYIPRINASPSLVAIVPSKQLESSSGKQIVPAGLWLHVLPYCDDLRETLPLLPLITAPDVLIDETRNIIRQLQLPGGIYDPWKYPNPILQWHYRILQAKALGEDIVDMRREDKTEPRYRQIEKRAGNFMRRWNKILEEQVIICQRKLYGNDAGSDLKREAGDLLDGSLESEGKKKIKMKPL